MKDELISLDFLEHIAQTLIPNSKVVEKHGLPNGTYTEISENGVTIYWDTLFWEYFEQTVLLNDTLPYNSKSDSKLITELIYNYNGVLFNHLSEKYKNIPELSSSFRKKAIEFNYPAFLPFYPVGLEESELSFSYYLQFAAVKLSILYHEIAHGLFFYNPKFKKEIFDIVKYNVSGVSSFGSFFTKEFKIKESAYKKMIKGIVSEDEQYKNILEELAADTYALSKTYATLHLNLKEINKQDLSDHILMGILRYSYIASFYSNIISFWNTIIPHYCIGRHLKEKEAADSVSHLKEMLLLREGIFGIISTQNVLQMDHESFSYPLVNNPFEDARVKNVIDVFTTNANYYDIAINSAFNVEQYNNVLNIAIEYKNLEHIPMNEYPIYDSSIIVSSWMCIQYHNNLGLNLYKHGDYISALKEYSISLSLSEKYLETNHILTARIHNNIVTACIELYKKTEDINYIYLGKKHSDLAINIAKKENELNVHIPVIYQNAGEIHIIFSEFEDAEQCYLTAKKMKESLYPKYNNSRCITDTSLAFLYFHTKRYASCKKLYTIVLKYLEDTNQEESEYYSMNKQLQEATEPFLYTGHDSIMSIFSSLLNGETVNLDEYNDFDSFLPKKKK